MQRRRPGSLGGRIDSQVYLRLREYQSAQNDPDIALPTSKLYQMLHDSDVSLRRIKRAILERSIETAMDQIRLEDMEEGMDEARSPAPEPVTIDSDEESQPTQPTRANMANQSITSLWSAHTSGESTRRPGDAKAAGGQKDTSMEDEVPARPSNSEKASSRAAALKRKQRLTNGTAQQAPESGREPSQKRPRAAYEPVTSDVRLADVGGVDDCVAEILELVALPLKHPEIYTHTGVAPPRGVLLHGPPGCGKTLLANALAGELGVPFISISAPSLVAGMSGESEKNVRDTFEEAKALAPCLMFFDEIDAVTPKRESAQREMERRIVAQFLTCMDECSLEKTDGKPVLIMGATNRPDSLDAALRRAGRFDREICMTVPDDEARERILRVLCSKLRLRGDFDFRMLARMTPGYVGADLKALTSAAGTIAIKRIFSQMSGQIDHSTLETSISHFLHTYPDPLSEEVLCQMAIDESDFVAALAKVQPSSKREGFATVPDVTWADVGALSPIRAELQMAIVQPIRHPELYASVGICAPAGVLLWGPPGCGKTLLAKAVANESRANFISVRGPELLNKYVGESERAVRQVFLRARASAPCVIFFDELDALVPRRDESLSESSARVVNTLLTELDGLNDRRGVYVIAATNRPDIIDPAMVRPGRLDKPLFVDLPTPEERVDVLQTLTARTPLAPDVDVRALAMSSRLTNYSGADMAALVREAAVRALRQAVFPSVHAMESSHDMREQTPMHPSLKVTRENFEQAAAAMNPSVSPQERQRYTRLAQKYGIRVEGE